MFALRHLNKYGRGARGWPMSRATFLFFRRTPNHLKFIRSIPCPDGVKPSATALVDRECLGWALEFDGTPVTLYYVCLDRVRDGLDLYSVDEKYPRGGCGSPEVKLNQPLLP